MNIELKPWTMDDLHDLVRLCNAADRTYLSGACLFLIRKATHGGG